jgi:solute carrier family 35 (UDP-sugar transporter), member A1/2/3
MGKRNTEAAQGENDKAIAQKALFFCSLLALQFGLQPMVAKKFNSPEASKSSLVIATELAKMVISAVTLYGEGPEVRAKIAESWSFADYLKVAALPAGIYAIQNLLMQHSLTSLDGMTINLLNQTKTLSAALFLYLVLGNKQSRMQIFALFLLLLAAVILTTSGTIDPSVYTKMLHGDFSQVSALLPSAPVGGDDKMYAIGIACVMGASALSGLSTALSQKALRSGRNAIFFTSELAFCGILVLLMTDFLQNDYQSTLLGTDLIKGWTPATLIPVLMNACGGIVVGFVTKYAGGVTKGFALIAGIIVTAVAEFVVNGTPLGHKHYAAIGLTSLAIFLHSSFGYAPEKKVKVA